MSNQIGTADVGGSTEVSQEGLQHDDHIGERHANNAWIGSEPSEASAGKYCLAAMRHDRNFALDSLLIEANHSLRSVLELLECIRDLLNDHG